MGHSLSLKGWPLVGNTWKEESSTTWAPCLKMDSLTGKPAVHIHKHLIKKYKKPINIEKMGIYRRLPYAYSMNEIFSNFNI
jgi:hypothetical protein